MLTSLVLGLCLTQNAVAGEQQKPVLTLGSYYIPGLVESSEKGSLIDLLDDIAEQANLSIDVRFLPTKRIQKQFAEKELIGYFPELEEHAPKDACQSEPIGAKSIHAFWRKGDTAPETVTGLEDHSVGIVAGYSYGKAVMQNDRIFKEIAANDDLNLRKLLAGRIDFIIGDERSTVAAIKKAGAEDKIEWQPGKPITTLPFFFLFQNTAQGRQYCDIFSRIMHEGRKNGSLRHL